jgi:hypothetical protein
LQLAAKAIAAQGDGAAAPAAAAAGAPSAGELRQLMEAMQAALQRRFGVTTLTFLAKNCKHSP